MHASQRCPDLSRPDDRQQPDRPREQWEYLNPSNPRYQAAATLCTKTTGYVSKFSTGAPQPGSINVTMAGGFGGKS